MKTSEMTQEQLQNEYAKNMLAIMDEMTEILSQVEANIVAMENSRKIAGLIGRDAEVEKLTKMIARETVEAETLKSNIAIARTAKI